MARFQIDFDTKKGAYAVVEHSANLCTASERSKLLEWCGERSFREFVTECPDMGWWLAATHCLSNDHEREHHTAMAYEAATALLNAASVKYNKSIDDLTRSLYGLSEVVNAQETIAEWLHTTNCTRKHLVVLPNRLGKAYQHATASYACVESLLAIRATINCVAAILTEYDYNALPYAYENNLFAITLLGDSYDWRTRFNAIMPVAELLKQTVFMR